MNKDKMLDELSVLQERFANGMGWRDGEYAEALDEAIELINEMPAADVAEIVKCKDCKHNIINHGRYCTFGDCLGCLVADDFFCKNGERKNVIEVKHSEWVHREDMDFIDQNGVEHFHCMCENCGFIHDFLDCHTEQYNFCPECGTDMRGETE